MWKPGSASSDNWVTATASLPVAFAQVREDPQIDRRLIEQVNSQGRVMMIASGGETAAVLAASSIESLHLVDMNSAQVALARLKLSMLADTSITERLQLLGYSAMDVGDRHRELRWRLAELELDEDVLGPSDIVAEMGPDFCARYEWLFARLREILWPHRNKISKLLSLANVEKQTECVAPGTELGQVLEQAFDEVMQLENLVEIFGPDATANRVMPFSTHFLAQIRFALSRFAAAENPFLHQILLGQFPGPRWDWLDLPKQSDLCSVQSTIGMMSDVIKAQPDGGYHLIHLSNILDWVKPSETQHLLNHARRCLVPGGIVVVRQLNSLLDIAAVDAGLTWERDLARDLHREDRSFFYRQLHIGRRA